MPFIVIERRAEQRHFTSINSMHFTRCSESVSNRRRARTTEANFGGYVICTSWSKEQKWEGTKRRYDRHWRGQTNDYAAVRKFNLICPVCCAGLSGSPWNGSLVGFVPFKPMCVALGYANVAVLLQLCSPYSFPPMATTHTRYTSAINHRASSSSNQIDLLLLLLPPVLGSRKEVQ